MLKLKQCPFCGKSTNFLHIVEGICWIECENFRSTGPRKSSIGTALDSWNGQLNNAKYVSGDKIPHEGANRVGRTGVTIIKTGHNS